MAVLHDEVRAEFRADSRTPAGRRAYAISLPVNTEACRRAAERAQYLGFDCLIGLGGTPEDPGVSDIDAMRNLACAAHADGLAAGVVISLDHVAPEHSLATNIAPGCFSPPPPLTGCNVAPRQPIPHTLTAVRLRYADDPSLLAWWRQCLDRLHQAGLDFAATLDPNKTGEALATLLSGHPLPVRCLVSQGWQGDGCYPMIASSNGSWLAGSRPRLAEIAIGAHGWVFIESSAPAPEVAIRSVNRLLAERERLGGGVFRTWTSPDADLQIRSRPLGDGALLLVHNKGAGLAAWPPANIPPMPWQNFKPIAGLASAQGIIAPRDALLFWAQAITPAAKASLLPAQHAAEPSRRISITRIAPSVDQGKYSIKSVIGATIQVEADIFIDGHEQLAAAVIMRAEGEMAWTRHMMDAQPNDIWTAAIRPVRLGPHYFVVQAWLDVWGGFVRDLARKVQAAQDVALELREARIILQAALARAPNQAAKEIAAALGDLNCGAPNDPVDFFSAAPLVAAMVAADNQRYRTISFEQPILVEREAAQFSSWYELFPRSQGPDAATHGTFADVAARLPHIAAMGFDTVYFPPIHPIGERNRKGPNNSATASPGDVGSPYAIGSADGGHNALHTQLGTLHDFQLLMRDAQALGLEIALDFAVQCAPDHPWLKQYPGWFNRRPDGSIKYAENPPKKYEDIVNVDFYAADAVPDLWHALRDIVLFWAGHGIRSFRVDNPHTKPLPFWQWLIESVKAVYPDALFLSEAFTRPKPMYQLAMAGFSQSYTYFTWRNDKTGLTEYFTELTETNVRNFFRPHLFVNTPDINPLFLQGSGRPGFLIRAALAATLSGLWGIYSGFELCEAQALADREEYLDSEKYQLRPRLSRVPGDIVEEIAQLNRLRRQEPALQCHLGLTFHNAFNDHVIYYSKIAPGEMTRILIAVSLDPHNAQDADIEVPLWLFGLADWQTVAVKDLLASTPFTWTGKIQHIHLTPQHPYAIWRIAAPGNQ